MSDNWYIVDTSGDTKGPMDELSLINLYLNETIHSKTYIWNGQTVKEWLPIMNVKYIYDKIKNHYIHQHDIAASQITETQNRNNVELVTNDKDPHDDTSTDEYTPYDLHQQYNEPKINNNKIIQPQIEENHEEKKEDVQIQNNVSFYPSKLQFLQQNSDRVDLMANIRNGITLRNQKTSTNPKRLKDTFQPNQADSKHNMYSVNKNHTDDDDDLSLSTSIDQDLISEVKQNGYHNRENQTKSFKTEYRNPSKQPLYTNEIAERMSLIRQRFGEVQVVSGKGRKNDISNDNNIQRKENNETISSAILKSGEIARRIAKLKYKLDQLTESESWIITRIENIFLTATK